MTEKRFTLHIDWFNYDKTDGEAILKDNGQPLLESDCVEDMRRLKDLLNELSDENEQLKTQSNSVYEIVKEYVVSHHCISTMRMLKKIEEVMWND